MILFVLIWNVASGNLKVKYSHDYLGMKTSELWSAIREVPTRYYNVGNVSMPKVEEEIQ